MSSAAFQWILSDHPSGTLLMCTHLMVDGCQALGHKLLNVWTQLWAGQDLQAEAMYLESQETQAHGVGHHKG